MSSHPVVTVAAACEIGEITSRIVATASGLTKSPIAESPSLSARPGAPGSRVAWSLPRREHHEWRECARALERRERDAPRRLTVQPIDPPKRHLIEQEADMHRLIGADALVLLRDCDVFV